METMVVNAKVALKSAATTIRSTANTKTFATGPSTKTAGAGFGGGVSDRNVSSHRLALKRREEIVEVHEAGEVGSHRGEVFLNVDGGEGSSERKEGGRYSNATFIDYGSESSSSSSVSEGKGSSNNGARI
jgi:hypothetical protein